MNITISYYLLLLTSYLYMHIYIIRITPSSYPIFLPLTCDLLPPPTPAPTAHSGKKIARGEKDPH